MARRIRLSLAQCYDDEYAAAMQLLGSLREELKQMYPAPDDRKVIFERIVYSDFMDMVRAGDAEGVEAWIQRDFAVELFRAAGQDFEALKRRAQTREFRPVPLGDATFAADFAAARMAPACAVWSASVRHSFDTPRPENTATVMPSATVASTVDESRSPLAC